ncbi:hypothetical protein QR680_006036 [Steinernema hermaphroditum]|uniref:Nuclear receptor domain-containing protein n=1 Tax=Steinernema hermaphroditum TaxID=289476 RepID=A0AA39LWF2_9BILA|nr:hypothetical protein QR680_006036 [Steinernema hermaphroditum]
MPSGRASTSDDECRICGSVPHGIHFGVYSCRACAAFFRRTVVNEKTYTCRRTTMDCNVKNTKRYPCRACRFEKCKQLGMKLSNEENNCSNSDSNDPASPLQPTNSVNVAEPLDFPKIKENSSELAYDVEPFLRSIGELINGAQLPLDTPLNPQIRYTALQRLLLAFNHFHVARNVKPRKVFELPDFIKDMESVIFQSCRFMMSCEEFAQLPVSDKWHLLRRSSLNILKLIRMHQAIEAFGFDANDDRLICCSDFYCTADKFTFNTAKMSDSAKENLNRLFRPILEKSLNLVLRPARKIRITREEIVYMCASCVWKIDYDDAPEFSNGTKKVAARFMEELGDDLHNHYKYVMRLDNYVNRLMSMAKLLESLEKMTFMRKEFMVLTKIFDIFSCSLFQPEYF